MPRWILPLNLTLGLAITAVAALIAADLLSVKIAALYPRTAPKQVAAQAATPAGSQDLMSFAPILERGLFGKATQGKLTPLQQQAAAGPAAAAPPPAAVGDLVLLGTAVGSFRETFALVLKNSSHEERVFRLGDTVFSAGPLVSVKKDVAEILVGGKRVKILTPMAAAAEAAAAPVAAPAAVGGSLTATAGAGGNYVIDQRALNAALDNIGQAMTDARLLPSMKDGKVEGFRASEVKPQGIFGTVGIRNGDVLLRMNDFPIDSPEKAIQSFASLKGQSRIKLDLIRDGKPTTFTYDIQ
ncbi:general secretion pathway protein GspC [Geomonas paludis]|uniref:General secretion pathway protein GspC n=1 Tax=Geomonas paludis TaxID=2740185 RepID=A0A6V8MSH5_9BACT|nr:type II secretion system protein GspC [Geomonas paludis]UPU35450.1 general secretion pathway protein GspC [Geomonas paludis]GFO62982.1 general secretion pathway protein GspC [Geomonas paludis]